MDSSLDPRAVLLGYYEHIASCALLNMAFYNTDTHLAPAVRSRMLETAFARAVEAEGEIATLEEYGIERWQATNGTGAC